MFKKKATQDYDYIDDIVNEVLGSGAEPARYQDPYSNNRQIQRNQPMQPTQPMQQAQQFQQFQQAQPMQPIQPMQPMQPAQPVQPMQPMNNMNPINGIQPGPYQKSYLNKTMSLDDVIDGILDTAFINDSYEDIFED